MSKSLYEGQTNRLLGYPDDARLLIINADDFGLCHTINSGIFQSIKEGIVQSTTLMTPCPWALHAIHLLQENPDIAFGVHLTAICEMVNYGWGPLTPKEKVPSMIDDRGYFYSLERMPEFLKVAKLDEVEVEFRAQIEMVLAANLNPTHLDWHCMYDGGRWDIFDMTVGLANEYGLAVRVGEQPDRLRSQGLPTNDHGFVDSFNLDIVDKSALYAQMLRDLPVGLTEWAVHPAIENDELLTIEHHGDHVRQTDFDFLMSDEAREIIQQEGIILLNYEPLQALWRNRSLS